MSFLSKIIGDSNEKYLKKIQSLVAQINNLEKDFEKFSEEELKEKTLEFKKRLQIGENLDNILAEAFALAREAAKRTLGQRHFDVQLLGGVALHQGKIAEMKTGEGKTLVATLAAYLNALEGKGAHVITVNDYLSRRDAVWMGQIYHALGLTVGCINHEASYLYDPLHTQTQNSKLKTQNHSSKLKTDLENNLDKIRDTQGFFRVVHEFLRPSSRREAYEADITYGTNNEFGFDFLRDNLVYGASQIAQKNHNFAIIDEVDSILIDEARTPLIISAPDEDSGELYRIFSRIAPRLKAEADYEIDEKMKAVSVSEEGIEKVEKILGVKDIYTEKGIKYVHHLEQALRAQVLFHRDKDYVVKSGEVIIIDEFTGRVMPGRRWSDGLHQAIEAKEGMSVQKESRTVASITFQNYFRMYKKISGMTGTALSSAEEFYKVYNLDVVVVPTNKPLVRRDLGDKVFQTGQGKFKAAIEEIKERNKKGQPVLVGTISIEKNEIFSKMLSVEGVNFNILNAKNHESEAEIIAQAGRKGAVTIATNMAGRGVDIVLGGNPYSEEKAEEVRNLGGLLVLGTERHEARRIDNQLRGRSGRQGDPGETRFFVSLDDDLMRIFGSDRLKNMMGRFGIPEDQPIENGFVSRAIESAQQKIEGYNFDARKHLLEYDDVINRQRNKIYQKRRLALLGGDEEFRQIIFSYLEAEFFDEILGQKKQAIGEQEFMKGFRSLFLQIIDMLWMGHLETMDYMRSSVQLRAYGQRDTLIEYKNEGARLFKELENSIAGHLASLMPKIGEIDQAVRTQPTQEIYQTSSLTGSAKKSDSSVLDKNTEILGEKKKIGRNDHCWCGSGKKFKRCHGQ
ncbi:MAG: preprotein translocase subunit SecA [Candidatus Tagabacteria bacterium RIFCSPLOWO2_01_FULL_39_11]|uniref:Protein translocase subunit SecA n=1 Tax=Candidatus Tagabacteria bacterium RIFCSPLOWO2_01_FULL_39_11 TaxID=1802295 RepID=A0A1G2LNB1_9BACT|nr:MAG: preprotein translocase subunit SecA [Candidatus Tagabacteria bacterium RIFCSPLOWO2_01_FULL_39_11]